MAYEAVIDIKKEVSFLEERGRFTGILSWILSTDHKRIGIMYLFSMLTMFSVGVTFAFLMRLELIAPGKTIIEPQTYNQFFTLHGVIMIFL
ncbi:MAG: cbb3-type cytochrome c oxidase subunit I, partial [bacterium]|nr:cbb3-type cytochrome c oxidase subunit I [bacterium]